jgi:hypothetical protein
MPSRNGKRIESLHLGENVKNAAVAPIFSAIKFPAAIFFLPQLTCSAKALGQLYANRHERSTTCGDKSAFEWAITVCHETLSWKICSF